MNAKRILVTGVTGMAGSHLVDLLLAEMPDAEVIGCKRWRSKMENLDHITSSKLTLVDCDLTDAGACYRLVRDAAPQWIFHLAGQSYVLDSWANPQSTIGQNTMMQLNIFEAVRECGIDPVIQIALSSEQYGKVLEHELPIKEDNPFRPLSPYAVSKVAQDMLGYQYFESYGLKVIRTRAFNHEGPRRAEVFVTSTFAKQIAEIEAGLREPRILVGNLDSRRDWTDVRDMVRGYWLSVQRCVPGEDYVIASGVVRTVREMLNALIELADVQVQIMVDPKRIRPSDVLVLQGDSTKFSAATGWKPQITFEQTMSDMLQYWRGRIGQQRSAQVSSGQQ